LSHPTDKYTLRATGDGWVASEFGHVPGADGAIVVEMERSLSIEGTVTLGDKTAFEGASVWAVPTGGEHEAARATTSPDGLFVLRDLPKGDYDVHVACESRHVVPAVARAAAGARGVALVARPGAVIRGVVRDIDGRPKKHVQVWIRPNDAASPTGGELRTSEDGTFAMDCLDPLLPYEVTAVLDITRAQEVRSPVRPGAQALDIVLRPGFEIVGALVDPDGAPVVGATVHATPLADGEAPEAGTTRDDGHVMLMWLADGAYRITVELAPGAAFDPPAELVVDAGARDLVLRCRAKPTQTK
jgi:hypothetical protein